VNGGTLHTTKIQKIQKITNTDNQINLVIEMNPTETSFHIYLYDKPELLSGQQSDTKPLHINFSAL
jgi:hypothetical protein